MQKRRALMGGLLILIICEMVISTTAIGTTIIIDGDFSDWDGLEPVFTEEEIHPDYWLDIQGAYITANDTMLFVRIDYAAPLDYWASLMTNITLQTPSNDVFILMNQIVYDSEPHWSFTAIFPGINLSTFQNDKENMTEIASYQNSVAISPSNTSVEYYYPLSDLGLTIDATINATFWHYEAISAGEYTVQLHKFAGTVYQISLKQTVNESSGTSGSTSTSTTTTTDTGTTTTDRVIFGLDLILTVVILVPLLRKKRN